MFKYYFHQQSFLQPLQQINKLNIQTANEEDRGGGGIFKGYGGGGRMFRVHLQNHLRQNAQQR